MAASRAEVFKVWLGNIPPDLSEAGLSETLRSYEIRPKKIHLRQRPGKDLGWDTTFLLIQSTEVYISPDHGPRQPFRRHQHIKMSDRVVSNPEHVSSVRRQFAPFRPDRFGSKLLRHECTAQDNYAILHFASAELASRFLERTRASRMNFHNGQFMFARLRKKKNNKINRINAHEP